MASSVLSSMISANAQIEAARLAADGRYAEAQAVIEKAKIDARSKLKEIEALKAAEIEKGKREHAGKFNEGIQSAAATGRALKKQDEASFIKRMEVAAKIAQENKVPAELIQFYSRIIGETKGKNGKPLTPEEKAQRMQEQIRRTSDPYVKRMLESLLPQGATTPLQEMFAPPPPQDKSVPPKPRSDISAPTGNKVADLLPMSPQSAILQSAIGAAPDQEETYIDAMTGPQTIKKGPVVPELPKETAQIAAPQPTATEAPTQPGMQQFFSQKAKQSPVTPDRLIIEQLRKANIPVTAQNIEAYKGTNRGHEGLDEEQTTKLLGGEWETMDRETAARFQRSLPMGYDKSEYDTARKDFMYKPENTASSKPLLENTSGKRSPLDWITQRYTTPGTMEFAQRYDKRLNPDSSYETDDEYYARMDALRFIEEAQNPGRPWAKSMAQERADWNKSDADWLRQNVGEDEFRAMQGRMRNNPNLPIPRETLIQQGFDLSPMTQAEMGSPGLNPMRSIRPGTQSPIFDQPKFNWLRDFLDRQARDSLPVQDTPQADAFRRYFMNRGQSPIDENDLWI